MRKCPVHYQPKRGLLSCLFLALAGVATTVSTSGLSQDLNSQRQSYTDAVQAIDRGHWTEYAKLRPALDD